MAAGPESGFRHFEVTVTTADSSSIASLGTAVKDIKLSVDGDMR
jgi:hypothetical protein